MGAVTAVSRPTGPISSTLAVLAVALAACGQEPAVRTGAAAPPTTPGSSAAPAPPTEAAGVPVASLRSFLGAVLRSGAFAGKELAFVPTPEALARSAVANGETLVAGRVTAATRFDAEPWPLPGAPDGSGIAATWRAAGVVLTVSSVDVLGGPALGTDAVEVRIPLWEGSATDPYAAGGRDQALAEATAAAPVGAPVLLALRPVTSPSDARYTASPARLVLGAATGEAVSESPGLMGVGPGVTARRFADVVAAVRAEAR